MSSVERAREEAGDAAGGAAGAGEAAAPAPAPPFASLTKDDVLLALGIIVQTLDRNMRAVDADALAARAASAAWSARPPLKGDEEGCLARARRSAELAAERAERAAAVAPQLLSAFATRATGLCRETWRCVPPGLSAADADRVRAGHPIWPRIINMRHGEWKETRLSWAARKGKLERVRELCEWRADIEAADKNGCTPLYDASYYGKLEVARELLARGANIEAAADDGATSLFIASQEGRLDVVRELLACGANIEAATNRGTTSLFMASQEGHLDVVRELLARGAVVDAAFDTGATPLFQASWKGHTEVVRALLAAGANKRHVDNVGATAHSLAGTGPKAPAGSRAAILALLAAAP